MIDSDIFQRSGKGEGSPRDRKEEREIELLLFMGLFIRDEMWWAQRHKGR